MGVGEKESGKGIVRWGGELEVGDAESGRELWRCEMGDYGLGGMEGTEDVRGGTDGGEMDGVRVHTKNNQHNRKKIFHRASN